MLDTNMASYVIKGYPPCVLHRLSQVAMDDAAISSVTHGELLFGLARKGNPVKLATVIGDFLSRVPTLAWDADAACAYANLRASCSASGINLGPLDMMIAAHAVAVHATLVTHDKAFSHLPAGTLMTEDWSI